VSLWLRCFVFLAVLPDSTPLPRAGRAITKRLITVSDIIGTTRVAGSPYFAYRPRTGFAAFSPDEQQFAIVLARGNVEANTNDYSLMLFRTIDALHGGQPKAVAAISSSSNYPGIFDLKWSGDNDSIYFLAAVNGNPTQLYLVRCSSGEMTRLTDHQTALTSYSVSEDGKSVVYEAESAPSRAFSSDSSPQGFHVSNEEPSDLIRGIIPGKAPELFVKGIGYAADSPLHTQGQLRTGYDLSLSPDGRYLVLETDAMEVPRSWSQYQDESIQAAFRRGFRKGSPTGIMEYELIDLGSGKTERLLSSPAGYCPSILWSPDSKSLILCGVYLPLDVNDPLEFQVRLSQKFVVEIDLTSRSPVKIAAEDLSPVRWDARTNIVEFQMRQSDGNTGMPPTTAFYERIENRWLRIEGGHQPDVHPRPDILVDEDLNSPPRLVALNPQTKQKVTILNLDSDLTRFELGKVEVVQWKDGSGKLISGELYLPPDYVTGKRYPLVIQTHGFDPHAFWLDGPYSSGYAAQALAGRGIAVLQMNDILYGSLVTRQEAARVMKVYENAVDYLDQKRIIDRQRVGLLGFSRTCYYVKYTLTHSRQRFAAAVASDGVDASYLQYLVAAVARPDTASEFDVMIGATPFGSGLHVWLKRSPGFLLDRVRTPLLIEAFEPSSILDEWQWFAGLKRLGKPVDLLYLPDGTHVLVKPWDRLASQESSADWFYFWLEDKEDPNPAKAEQYRRWRKLRSG
jgi:dipeptidyl aminopeptidase/acylaminoacyl peptidase